MVCRSQLISGLGKADREYGDMTTNLYGLNGIKGKTYDNPMGARKSVWLTYSLSPKIKRPHPSRSVWCSGSIHEQGVIYLIRLTQSFCTVGIRTRGPAVAKKSDQGYGFISSNESLIPIFLKLIQEIITRASRKRPLSGSEKSYIKRWRSQCEDFSSSMNPNGRPEKRSKVQKSGKWARGGRSKKGDHDLNYEPIEKTYNIIQLILVFRI